MRLEPHSGELVCAFISIKIKKEKEKEKRKKERKQKSERSRSERSWGHPVIKICATIHSYV